MLPLQKLIVLKCLLKLLSEWEIKSEYVFRELYYALKIRWSIRRNIFGMKLYTMSHSVCKHNDQTLRWEKGSNKTIQGLSCVFILKHGFGDAKRNVVAWILLQKYIRFIIAIQRVKNNVSF